MELLMTRFRVVFPQMGSLLEWFSDFDARGSFALVLLPYIALLSTALLSRLVLGLWLSIKVLLLVHVGRESLLLFWASGLLLALLALWLKLLDALGGCARGPTLAYHRCKGKLMDSRLFK